MPHSEATKKLLSKKLKGRKIWNKGLTKDMDNRVLHISESQLGKNNSMYGKAAWNRGLTAKTNKKIRNLTLKSAETIKRMYKEGKLVVHNKGKPFIKVNLQNTPNLCYILGVLLGDGYIHHEKNGGYRIGLTVIDESFAKTFQKALKVIGLNPWLGKGDKTGRFYCVCTRSLQFFNWYKALTIKEIRRLASESPKHKISLLKGLFESEGSFYYKPRKSSGHFIWRLSFSNTNKQIIDLFVSIATTLGYNFHIHKVKNRNLYQVYKTGEDFVKQFLAATSPCITRKSLAKVAAQTSFRLEARARAI